MWFLRKYWVIEASWFLLSFLHSSHPKHIGSSMYSYSNILSHHNPKAIGPRDHEIKPWNWAKLNFFSFKVYYFRHLVITTGSWNCSVQLPLLCYISGSFFLVTETHKPPNIYIVVSMKPLLILRRTIKYKHLISFFLLLVLVKACDRADDLFLFLTKMLLFTFPLLIVFSVQWNILIKSQLLVPLLHPVLWIPILLGICLYWLPGCKCFYVHCIPNSYFC